MKRVVVTGVGIVSPLGIGVEECWANAVRGKSGVAKCVSVDLSKEPVQIAAEVKNFEASKWMNEKEAKRTQRFVQFAIAASKMALENGNFKVTPELAPFAGVSIGSGVGSAGLWEENVLTLHSRGSNRVSPFTVPGFIANMAAGGVAIEAGFKGPNMCATTACASGTHSIGEAMMYIQTGRAKVMLAGGTEAAMSPLCFAGFSRMGALCKAFNDRPEEASRPFDKDRCGFVMGEGAGVLLLEELEFAKARGANILCELVGYGLSGDAHHITMPAEGGEGAIRAMKMALDTGEVDPNTVDYINAHGTSTEANDMLETAAIKTLFGSYAYKINISSTKSMTGHLLGGAGGVEAVFTVMAMKTGTIPPTINLTHPDPACDLNYTPNQAVQRKVDVAMSNSFGFGGTNACLVFRKLKD